MGPAASGPRLVPPGRGSGRFRELDESHNQVTVGLP